MNEIILEQLLDVSGFFIKAAIIIIGLIIILSFTLKDKLEDKVSIKNLNKKFNNYRKVLFSGILSKKDLKKQLKALDKLSKTEDQLPTTFILNFKGDIHATAVDSLRESVTAILAVASPADEVVVCLESPGGVVHGYGLAASQLQRIKDHHIRLVACVDKVAASGGYMMACLANEIIAAPFSIIGSVGVVASVPNFNKILKKNNVDYYQITSGKFKRTLTLLGEVTEEGLDKFKQDIEDTHSLFKSHVKKYRPQVDIEQIATGEHWYGQQALSLNLVDQLGTSDDYLLKLSNSRKLREVDYQVKKTLKDKIAEGLTQIIDQVWTKLLSLGH